MLVCVWVWVWRCVCVCVATFIILLLIDVARQAEVTELDAVRRSDQHVSHGDISAAEAEQKPERKCFFEYLSLSVNMIRSQIPSGSCRIRRPAV